MQPRTTKLSPPLVSNALQLFHEKQATVSVLRPGHSCFLYEYHIVQQLNLLNEEKRSDWKIEVYFCNLRRHGTRNWVANQNCTAHPLTAAAAVHIGKSTEFLL
jgi:hypothetical protein